jgi:hypothetical protein
MNFAARIHPYPYLACYKNKLAFVEILHILVEKGTPRGKVDATPKSTES